MLGVPKWLFKTTVGTCHVFGTPVGMACMSPVGVMWKVSAYEFSATTGLSGSNHRYALRSADIGNLVSHPVRSLKE